MIISCIAAGGLAGFIRAIWRSHKRSIRDYELWYSWSVKEMQREDQMMQDN